MHNTQLDYERPILYSADMVLAILADKKTETRRVVRLPKDWRLKDFDVEYQRLDDGRWQFAYGFAQLYDIGDVTENLWQSYDEKTIKCPYGDTGTRLYVRERFVWLDEDKRCELFYATARPEVQEQYKGQWKPSIHMPKAIARIKQLVHSVHVEWLQDITEAGARAEGCESIDDFHQLWDSINAKRGFGWDENPIVWVVDCDPQLVTTA